MVAWWVCVTARIGIEAQPVLLTCGWQCTESGPSLWRCPCMIARQVCQGTAPVACSTCRLLKSRLDKHMLCLPLRSAARRLSCCAVRRQSL